MKEFIDRVIEEPSKKVITHADGSTEEVDVRSKHEPTVVGTPINRKTMMELQGFQDKVTTIERRPNGTFKAVETTDDGVTVIESFKDGVVRETFTGERTIVRETRFNGNIVTEIVYE